MDLEYKVFIGYIIAFSINSADKIHPLKRTLIASLKTDKVFIEISSKYNELVIIFLSKLAIKLLKYMNINNHTIGLINDQKYPYYSIYCLGLVELETLKDYIENNLTNGFINPFKFSIRALISFNKMTNGRLRLYINY